MPKKEMHLIFFLHKRSIFEKIFKTMNRNKKSFENTVFCFTSASCFLKYCRKLNLKTDFVVPTSLI